MTRKLCGLTLLLCGAGLAGAGCVAEPAEELSVAEAAITHGELDGEDHPYTGIAFFGDYAPDGGIYLYWRCSGTLISPTEFITAGHCTYDGGWVPPVAVIWFDSDMTGGFNGNYVIGTPKPHPEYADFAGFPNTHDVGKVDLWWGVNVARYAQVAAPGELDAYLEGPNNNRYLEAVGYGLQKVGNPQIPDDAEWLRKKGTEKVVPNNSSLTAGFNIQTTDTPRKIPKGILSDPDYIPAAAGGTCFGDSGGPQLLPGTDTLVAVTSFGLNGKCKGVGFHYRIDTDIIDF